jgi:uncharacterized RDD family membrane protein YckC
MRSPTARTDDRYSFATPEQLDVSYDIAGLGSRFLAALVDTLVLITALIALDSLGFFGLSSIFEVIRSLFGLSGFAAEAWAYAFLLLLNFAVIWGYYLIFEAVWHGQTPGKRLVGIRVIKSGGYPLRFSDSLVRNLVRIIDFLPGYYGIGAVVMLIDRHSRRLGDLAAGTIVVREPSDLRIDALDPPQSAPRAIGSEPGSLVPSAPAYDLARLTSRDESLLREYLARRPSLPRDAADRLATQIAGNLARKLDHDLGAEPPDAFLQHLARQLDARARMAEEGADRLRIP